MDHSQPIEGTGISAEQLQRYSDEFDLLCQNRHAHGEVVYGPATFMQNDVLKMAAEELVDFANYSRYMYIKLRAVADAIEAHVPHSGVEAANHVLPEPHQIDPSDPINLISGGRHVNPYEPDRR